MIHLPAAGTDGSARPLGAMLELAIREERRGQPGTENVLSRLSELMLVEAIRRYLIELPSTQRSWLAGLRDPVVGRALEVLHSAPRQPWKSRAWAGRSASRGRCWRRGSPRWSGIRPCTT